MRLLTYNIHRAIGGTDNKYDLNRVIELIESQNPDIICLQEVDRNVKRSGNHNQPHLIAEYFRCESSIYQMNHPVQDGGYGNMVLSRWHFEQTHQISLQWGPRKARGAQIAVVSTPEGRVHVVNAHLGLGKDERRWQLHYLLNHRLFRESEHLPTLIAGDLNDWRNLLRKVVEPYGFEQVTRPVSRFRTFPAAMPIGSLDKVFARGPFPRISGKVVRTNLSRVASDHLPVIVDFHLKEPEELGRDEG